MATKTAKKRASEKPEKTGTPNPRRAMEQTMLQISRLLEEKGFTNAEEANAFLETLGGDGFNSLSGRIAAPTAREEAQELAYQAMEARTEAQARKLAQRALTKDPDCVDALLVLNEIEANSPEQTIEALRNAVAAGERSLGTQVFKRNRGHFWGILETRPYMRAKQDLAEVLALAGRFQEAIVQYESMLELNPNDNQGVRELLLGLYLQTGNVDAAGKLLKKYKGEGSVSFAWGRVLERLLADDPEGAATSLNAARKGNPHMELFMTAQKRMPDTMPDYYSMGSEEEAICSLPGVVAAWTAHPEAMFWLLSHILGDQPAGLPTPRAQTRKKPLFRIQ